MKGWAKVLSGEDSFQQCCQVLNVSNPDDIIHSSMVDVLSQIPHQVLLRLTFPSIMLC